MPDNRGDEFWHQYDEDRSEGIVYGNIPDEFHRVYEDFVTESPVYAGLDDYEKLIVADDWVDMFIMGGYSRDDMEAWFDVLGLDIDDLSDSEYASLYDSIYG